MTTREEIAKIIAYLASFWPNSQEAKAVDNAQADKLRRYVDAWYTVVSDLPLESLWMAAKHLASKPREFMPPAGVVRATVFELQENVNGDTPSPEEAWWQLENLFSIPPSMRNGRVHPLVQEAIDAMGGLQRIGQEPMDMVASTRARFCRAYEALVARQRRNLRMLPDVKQHVAELGEGDAADEIKKLAATLSG